MSETPRARLGIEPAVLERFPSYRCLVVYATGLTNAPSEPETQRLLTEAFEGLGAAADDPKSDPHIAAWRQTYSAFGAKPSRYPSSVEALISRARGAGPPAINALVDVYNAISIRHVLPIGGEDWDRLAGPGTLRFADGSEPFVVVGGDEEEVTNPKPGEVIWSDREGVTCRRWNWRQCRRTRLEPDSTAAYFLLEAIGEYPTERLEEAGADLRGQLRDRCPDVTLEEERLGAF